MNEPRMALTTTVTRTSTYEVRNTQRYEFDLAERSIVDLIGLRPALFSVDEAL